jgi:antibiotic biosynthesis monooxygenase (ABM) superfamily enzyme
MNAPSRPDQGATAVITHRVPAGQHAAYDDWLKEIGPLCRGFPGHVDWQLNLPALKDQDSQFIDPLWWRWLQSRAAELPDQ